jgi:hypothetical protein
MRRFYNRPGYLWKEFKKVRGVHEFWAKAKIGARILKPRKNALLK